MCLLLAERPKGVEDFTCYTQMDWTARRLRRLDGKLDRAMGRGGTEHGLTSIKCSALCIQCISDEMCVQLKPLKMLREPYSVNEVVVHTHWALTDKMECKC